MPLPDHVLTTSERSAAIKGRPWLRLLRERRCLEGLYMFTDGSTLGSYAAVLVNPATGRVEEAARWRPPTKTRNVGAEWDGLVLGLELLPVRARATMVVDLLWIHAQLIGVRRTVHVLRLREHGGQRAPDPEVAVADHELRRLEAAPLEIPQDRGPVLRRFPVSALHGEDHLLPVAQRRQDDQDRRLVPLEPGLHVHAVDPFTYTPSTHR
jgi:hypothetical protein